MIKKLFIRNFTLIEKQEIEFFRGFSVITGETGAGKSIIIGAISLLLGNRADARLVKMGKDKCVVEAVFDLSIYENDLLKDFFDKNDLDYLPEETILRREVSAAGKSRAFINDTPVTLSTLRELGEQLVDIHSQHQNLLLNKEDFQMEVVDIMAHDKLFAEQVSSAFSEYKKSLSALERLKNKIAENKKNEDFLRFQQNEISSATLAPEEQDDLEKESSMMAHAEEIKGALHTVDGILNNDEAGVVGQVKSSAALLKNVEDNLPSAKELSSRLDNCYIELEDISREISEISEDVEFEPQRLQLVNSRLDVIYTLEQKYHVESIPELLSLLDDINRQLSEIDNADGDLSLLEQRTEELRNICAEKAEELSCARKKAAALVEKELSKRLVPLGIPNIRFKVEMLRTELSESGFDKVQFLFSSNSSSPMSPIAEVASGGEIARVMLSLKAMISNAIGLPTIIFDEIDTGVSGRVAEMMAQIMDEMGRSGRQVICITHLPQIAAIGATHYKVEKAETNEGTLSTIKKLSNEERVVEIAKMLSGSEITEAATDNAKSLLKLKK